MPMFSMKPEFNLAEFLAQPATKKSTKPKTARKTTPEVSQSETGGASQDEDASE